MSKKTIWISRTLTDDERIFCDSLQLNMIEIPAIEVVLNPHENVAIPHNLAWAFTSQHAVEWIKKVIDDGLLNPELLPDQWFAIGEKTAKGIKDLKFDPILPDQAYGTNLAVLLETHKVSSVLHFTGNLARPELAQLCLIYGINYRSLEVYKTKILEPKSFPTKKPDAVLFLSPSAVEGFTASKEAKKRLANIPIFAIGKTTQQALSDLKLDSKIPAKATFFELLNLVASH